MIIKTRISGKWCGKKLASSSYPHAALLNQFSGHPAALDDVAKGEGAAEPGKLEQSPGYCRSVKDPGRPSEAGDVTGPPTLTVYHFG